MKFKLKINFNINWFFKLIYPIVIVAIIAGTGLVFNFLYKDFYQSITQAEEVSILRAEVAPEVIDINEFDQVLQQIDEKINKPVLQTETLNNPFILNEAIELSGPELQ